MTAAAKTDIVSAKPLRLLFADDNPHDAELQLRRLTRAGLAIEPRFAERESEYRGALVDFAPDVILCDFEFPDFDGLAALRIAAELAPGTPVILVSGTVTEERAAIAVRHGAVDYVLKTNLGRLPAAVTRAAEEATEKRRLLAAEVGLRRVCRVRDVLSAVNSAIVRIDEPAALFHEACLIATSVGGFPVAMIATIDPASGSGDVRALIGDFPRDAAADVIAEVARDPHGAPGIVADSLRAQRPVVVNDVGTHAGGLFPVELLRNAGVRAMGSFPFAVEEIQGCLFLGVAERDFFTDDEIELVTGMTNNLAFALELAAKRKRIEYLSYYDALTELPNRTLFSERLRQEIAAAARRNDRLALIVFDVAQFASINTSLGEWAGDTVLRTIAKRLAAWTDRSLIGRVSGDRFAVIVAGLRSARDVTTHLGPAGMALLVEPILVGDRELRVTAHVGCAVFPDDGADADEISRNAQAALQSARAEALPYRFFAPELNMQVARRLDLEARLRRAAADRTFLLHYQPKVDLLTRSIVGVEALMRWRDPTQPDKLISPYEFIPILEDTGLIVEVGRWALDEAVRQHHAWLEAGLDAPRIAVNVSAVQLRGSALVDEVRSALALHPGESGLDLEVTESGLMGKVAEASATLRAIRDLGVEISMDDFGTGYSSLSHVFQLPITTLKIDRTFVDGMTDHADKTTLVSTMISLARELKLKVVAEGVETEEQARLLRLLRCDQMQGFLIAKPLPPAELAALLVPRGRRS